jgi:hypothetical protein
MELVPIVEMVDFLDPLREGGIPMPPDEPDQTTPSAEPAPEPTPTVEVAPEQEPVVSAALADPVAEPEQEPLSLRSRSRQWASRHRPTASSKRPRN